MNQFKHAWNFYLNNWQYFFILAAPVMFIEGLVAYLILPVQNLTQPEDIVDFFNSNASLIVLVMLFGITYTSGPWLLRVSVLGVHTCTYSKYSPNLQLMRISLFT